MEWYEMAELIYEETCICDTSLCNVKYHPKNFYCNGGDYDEAELESNPFLVNETHSCYTNRKQCYIMKYQGNDKMFK